MAAIKTESQEPSLPLISTDSSNSERESRIHSPIDKEWKAKKELALLNAVAHCKPVGMHKYFRIVSVLRRFTEETETHCSIKDIWELINEYYGSLDELEEEDEEEEEEEREEQEKQGGDGISEFTLPLDDYEQLISEHRRDDQSSSKEESPEPSRAPSPAAKRTRTSKRDTSPTVSATSTPEPDDGKSTRRASRSTRKADTTETNTSGRQPSSRRSSKASSAVTGTRGSRRQTKKK